MSGCRDRQKNSILVELTVWQINAANAFNSVVTILKKVHFVTLLFFFMVELLNFLNAPRKFFSYYCGGFHHCCTYLLMRTLLRDEVNQVASCNAVYQAARPRSVTAPVLFGVGVEMDQGSR